MLIRPFNETLEEFQALTVLHNAVWVEYQHTLESYIHEYKSKDPQFFRETFLIEVEGKIIGSGIIEESGWSYKPDKYILDFVIHPDYQGQGYGTQLYNHLFKRANTLEAKTLFSGTRSDLNNAIKFFEKHGYKQTQTEPISVLVLNDFNISPFLAAIDRVEQAGIKIHTLSELILIDPDWQRKSYDLVSAIILDIPSTDPITPSSFANFIESNFNSPNFRSDYHIIAVDGDRWVGVTGLWLNPSGNEYLYTGLTGVLREYRRRGIATALKVKAISIAKEAGVKNIRTDNNATNPMLVLNKQLGFKPGVAWLEYVKELS
jgi:mycothiol synthase